MKKSLILLLPLYIFGGDKLPYFVNDKHGYLPKNEIDIGVQILKMNNTLDLLNFKESEFSGNNLVGQTNIGDMNGIETFARWRFADSWMSNFKYSKTNLSYGVGTLKNQTMDAFIRRNIISKNFAMDIGLKKNKALNDIKISVNNLKFSDFKMTESEINNLASNATINGGNISIEPNTPDLNGDYICDNTYTHCLKFKKSNGTEAIEGINSSSFYDAMTNNPDIDIDIDINQVEATIQNLEDNTVYLRGVKSITDGFQSLDSYISLEYTKISSNIDASADANIRMRYKTYDESANESFNKANVINLDRTENKITFGLNYSAFVGKWAMDALYEFDYFLRDDELRYINHNHKIDINIGYEIFKNTKFFVGGKVMSNQFNGEIPYLYNKYTQTSFDHKYGWAKTGLIYSF